MPNTVAIKLVQSVLDAASNCGLSAEELLRAIHLDPAGLEEVDKRIPHEQFCALWQEITRRASHSSIGLQMAEAFRVKSWDVLGYAMNSSANLEEAFERLVRYSRLRHTGVEFTFNGQDGVARLTMAIPHDPLPLNSAFCEWIGTHFVLISRRLTGLDLVPLMMGFQHSKPDDLSAYDRLFRAPLQFDQPVNEMRLDAKFLQYPLVQADLGLSAVLDRYAEELLAKLPKSESFLDTVRQILSQGLRGGDPSLTAIAKQLGYAPRTLQRKLQEAGTSYHTLLDEMRQELSFYYLRDAQIAVSEVAFLLGFSETSAFHRAFKRWTGTSPGEFRLADATTPIMNIE
jgi:AraC-like DNA-binding protein